MHSLGTQTNRVKALLWLAGVAFLIFLGAGIYRAGLGDVARPLATTDVVFESGSAHGRRITNPSWSADYSRAVSNADQTVIDLYGVTNGTIFKGGKPYLRVRAAHVSVNTITHDFMASGDILIKTFATNPTRSFATTSAVWNEAAQRLTLSQHVTIHSASGTPLSVGSLSFDVKTGDIDVREVAGGFRF